MTFSLMLDLVMTFLLAGTIYFVWRLSEQMARFRNNRVEMERLIRDLNLAVDRAQQSIISLRGAADTSGEELQKIMRSATELSDELQIMTESANALASRLERAAGSAGSGAGGGGEGPSFSSGVVSVSPRNEDRGKGPLFAIRDPEFDGTVEPDQASLNWSAPEEENDERSEAEKNLMRAISRNKKGQRSGPLG